MWRSTRGQTRSDLEHPGKIRYSFNFEGLGLGFGGKWLEKNRDYRVSKGTRLVRFGMEQRRNNFLRIIPRFP